MSLKKNHENFDLVTVNESLKICQLNSYQTLPSRLLQLVYNH